MGTTSLKTRRQKLAAKYGRPHDRQVETRLKTIIDAAVGDGLRKIYRHARWNFLDHYERIRMYAGTQDGTVACDISSDDTAVAGTDTTFTDLSSAVNVLIRVGNDIHRVASITDDTNLVLTDAALLDWDGASFILYAEEFSASASLETVDAMWIGAPDRALAQMGAAEMAGHKALGHYAGHPQFYSPRGLDSSGYTEFEFYPIPWYDEIVHVVGRKAGTIPTADGDTDSVPDRFSDIVDLWAEFYFWQGMEGKQARAAQAGQFASAELARMVQLESPSQGPDAIALDPAVHGSRPMTPAIVTTQSS